MEIAERIGRTAFEFNLVFSLLVTVIGMALLASGINPGEKVTGLFIPLSWLYQKTMKIQHTLPGEPTPWDMIAALGATGLMGIMFEFLFMMLGGFLVLVYTLSTLLPQQFLFLIAPLYFIGAFLQLMVWIYMFNMLLNRISSLMPFARSSSTG